MKLNNPKSKSFGLVIQGRIESDLRTYNQKYNSNDAIQSMQILKKAFNTDVSPIVAMARFENGNSIDPIKTYRKLDYKKKKSLTRKNEGGSSSGIV